MMDLRPIRKKYNPAALELSGIPTGMLNITLDDLRADEMKSAFDFVREYTENICEANGRGIFFYGSNGTGKTTLACIILKAAYMRYYRVHRVTVAEYIRQHTSVWSLPPAERNGAEIDLLDRYRSVDFLCLEELGKEIDTRVVRPILEELLRWREDHKLVTIYCTNLSKDDIKDMYGESIHSIIRGNSTSIKMQGVDNRYASR